MKKRCAFQRGGVTAARRSAGLLLPAALALLISVRPSSAEDPRFFRIVGSGATTITCTTKDGYVTWTNAVTNVTCTVQTALTLVGPSNWVDYVQMPISNHVITQRLFDPNPPGGMAFIPAGSFTMGNCMDTNEGASAELPLHTVYVSAFYMDRHEVTKALWDEVYNWAVTHGYSFEYGAAGKASSHPAQNMTWYDAVKWCNARSEKEGRIPAYYTDMARRWVYRCGQVDVLNDWVKWNTGYRLPTEAEWEKAARGGASGKRFPWSDANTISQSRANYYSYWSGGVPYYPYDVGPTSGYDPTFATGGDPYTSPVGYFGANGYGLYDMAGNVWELCWDWYLPTYYSSSPSSDPRGPASGWYRVGRGGSCNDDADCCRVASRYFWPVYRSEDVGFRCVLPPSQ